MLIIEVTSVLVCKCEHTVIVNMSERFKVTKFEEPSKNYKNYGATSAESDVELKGKLLSDSGEFQTRFS